MGPFLHFLFLNNVAKKDDQILGMQKLDHILVEKYLKSDSQKIKFFNWHTSTTLNQAGYIRMFFCFKIQPQDILSYLCSQ